jgi:hypothetical protein
MAKLFRFAIEKPSFEIQPRFPMGCPGSKISLDVETFVAAITGRPTAADTAAFVAAITGQPCRGFAETTPSAGQILGEANFNPSEPRDEKGRWTCGPAWTGGMSRLTSRKIDKDTLCTRIKRGPSNQFFQKQTWSYGTGEARQDVAFRVVKPGTVVVYLTHWEPPYKRHDSGSRGVPIIGNPADGPAAGRVGYLSCWGNDYNDGPSKIKNFPDKLNGLIGDAQHIPKDDVSLGKKYGKDVSGGAVNNGMGLGAGTFRDLMTKAWDAAVDQGKEMASARIPMPNKNSIGSLYYPEGVNVIFVSDNKEANERHPDFRNRGVHCNRDGTATPIRVHDWDSGYHD